MRRFHRRSPLWALAPLSILLLAGAVAAQSLPGFSKPGPRTHAPAEAAREQHPPVEPGKEVIASAAASATTVAPGGELVIAVVLDHAPGWHTWPSATQDVLPKDIAQFAIRTEIELDSAPGWVAAVGPVQWPDPTEGLGPDVNTGGTMTLNLYQGRAVAFIPLKIKADAAPGTKSVSVLVSYQACDDTVCVMPEDRTLEVSIEIAPGAPAAFASAAEDFESFRADVFGTPVFAVGSGDASQPSNPASPVAQPASEPTDAGPSFFGVSLGSLTGPVGLALLFLLSALGGAILNLTPCVLPVIPIKVMTLTRHAGTPGKSMYLGFWMALGVIAFWVAIGLPVALLNFGDPSRIFGYWYVTFGIGALIAIMALGLMGLFTLTLPQSVYMVNPNAETAPGSFLFGAMTAVLGLPCFGFVAGALLAAATKWGAATTLGVFTAIGIGMAAPYLILSARPSLLKSVPKTGPASELVKQVMGLLLLAAGAYFIGSGLIGLVAEQPWIAKQLHWWAVAVFATMAGVWLLVRTAQISKRAVPTVGFAIVGIVIAGVAVLYAMQSTDAAKSNYIERQVANDDDATLTPGTWVDYTPERFEAAKAADMIIVLDFTAEWCLNCKALKAAVLNRDPVKPLLHDDSMALLTVDLTSRTAPGWDLLKSLGRTGIPLLVIYGPGLPPDQPWMSNAYTPDQVTQAIASAKTGGPASAHLSAKP